MKPPAENRKTVFVLGAGFSMDAGGPSQDALLARMLSLTTRNSKSIKAKKSLRKFIADGLGLDAAGAAGTSLEDVFTPIDRCIANGVALRDYGPRKLQEVRREIQHLITLAIDQSFSETPSVKKDYVKQFATYLGQLASVRAKKARRTKDARAAKKYDPIAVISSNWDICFDKELHQAISRIDKGKSGDYDPIGVVDYCCYISSVDPSDRRIRPGLWALGAKGYNVKLLKIHGSMNWVQCINCQRLFVQFDTKFGLNPFAKALSCRHCKKFGIEAGLESSLVMPTFLKDLSNFQIKLIWQNAGVELMEARQLVFVGYSLPQADFEFRQLLSRMVRKDAEIHVVSKEPIKTAPPRDHLQYEDMQQRFRSFFSGRKISFEGDGADAFVKRLVS